MNVLVVGGAGYIGSHCVRQLAAAGHRPVVLDNLVYGHRRAVAPPVPFHEGDLGDGAVVRRVLTQEQIGLVMHFAAFCYVGESVTDPLKYYLNNVGATLHLLKAMLAVGGEAVRLLLHLRHLWGSRPAADDRGSSAGADQSVRPDQAGRGERAEVARPRPRAELRRLPLFQRRRRLRGRFDRRGPRSGDAPDPPRDRRRAGPAPSPAALRHGLPHPGRHLPARLRARRRSQPRPHRRLRAADDARHCVVLQSRHGPAFLQPRGDPRCGEDLGARCRWWRRPAAPAIRPRLYADSSLAKRELGWQAKFGDIESIVATAWKWHSTHPKGFADRGR